MKIFKNKSNKGMMIIPAIVIVLIFIIFSLKANETWDMEIRRELEKELIFRGKQFVYAIEKYYKKKNNATLKDFKTLYEKKFIRKLYTDPISQTGKWNIVMTNNGNGSNKKKLLIVPEELLETYMSKARIVGVCSTADDVGYMEYRGKNNYNEWAFYIGADENKEMPELQFVKE